MINIKDTSIDALYVGNEEVTKVYLGDAQVYPAGQPSHDYSQDYLTFNILSGGTISWKASHSAVSNKIISYSFDDGTTWTELSSTINGVSFNVNAGDTVLLKGTNGAYGNFTQYNTFSGSTAYFDVAGNIMSLIYGDNFVGQTALTVGNEFRFLFVATNIISAENLVLPATTFAGTTYNYTALFHQCSKMVLAPKILPALTLPQGCYNSMFNGCTSLTTAPELPATGIGADCYKNMFIGCTSLTTSPVLHIAALNSGSYQNMFSGCTNLNSITCLATDISGRNCTTNWVDGVAATGTFIKAASMSNWTTGVNGIPDGWTVQDFQ